MSEYNLEQLRNLYSFVFHQDALLPETSCILDQLVHSYPSRDESVLHLSLIRRLFSEKPPSVTTPNMNRETDSTQTTLRKKGGGIDTQWDNHSKAFLCRNLIDSDKFIQTMVHYLSSEVQLVSFSACKAITAVMTTKEYKVSREMKDKCLCSILSMVDRDTLRSHVSAYIFQIFADTLKGERKSSPEALITDTLSTGLTLLHVHWARILQDYLVLFKPGAAPPLIHATNTDHHIHLSQSNQLPPTLPETQAQLTTPPTTTLGLHAVADQQPVGGKELELSLGEFLSLTVEIVRHFERVECHDRPRQDSDCTNIETRERGVVSSEKLLVTEFQGIIFDNLHSLTFLVNQCVTNSLYVLKRLMDLLLKLMTRTFLLPSHPHMVTASQAPPASHPHTVTVPPAPLPSHPHVVTVPPAPLPSHPHAVTMSPATPLAHPRVVTMSPTTPASHPHMVLSQATPASPPHLVTTSPASHPHMVLSQATPTSPPHLVTTSPASHPHMVLSQATSTSPPHLVTTSPASHPHMVLSQAPQAAHPHTIKPNLLSSNLKKVKNNLHECLKNLTRNSALNSSFRFWIDEASIGMQDVPPHDDKLTRPSTSTPQEVVKTPPGSIGAGPSIETGLMYTVMRKALLSLLEFSAIVLTDGPHCPSKATYISDCDSLLQTIVMWAEQTIPQSFSSILDGLLQDDVESPLLGFLRLVFFKLLTEQDNCFVKALCTCVDIHRVMVTQSEDDQQLDIPMLEFGLQIFNVHAMFVLFLSSIGFDATVLLDFVMSHETNFSEFLVGYLEICCMEKKMSRNFNYDLPSACAELDIVDQYLDMDTTDESESDDEHNEESIVEVDASSPRRIDVIQTDTVASEEQRTSAERHEDYSLRGEMRRSTEPEQCVVASGYELPTTQYTERTVLVSNEYDQLITKDNSGERLESDGDMKSNTMQASHLADGGTKYSTMQSSHLAKRESNLPLNKIEVPLTKKQKLSLGHTSSDEQNDILDSSIKYNDKASSFFKCDLPLGQQPNSSAAVITHQSPQSILYRKSSPNILCTSPSVMVTETTHDQLDKCSSEPSDYIGEHSPMSGPPVHTLCQVLQCLIDVKSLLCRSCAKDLLSMRLNNISSIIAFVDTLVELFSDLF